MNMLVSFPSALRLSLLSMTVLCAKFLFAQSPINITVNVLPPYPNYVDEVIQMNEQTIITIHNSDLTNSHTIKLMAELSGSNGIKVRTKENALPNSPIELAAGETVVMTGEELSIFYNNYSESDFDFVGISREDIINNQQLPDGMYSICLRAFDYQFGVPLSANSPSGCSSPFVVLAADPPIINYPLSNTIVTPITPQLLNINWIPASVSLPDLRYRLEMVDLTNFPMNPYDAFQTDNFLFFAEDDIMANVFLYGMEHPLLIPGHQYAMRVKAYRQDGSLNVLNNGYSDIVTFSYGQEIEVGTGEELTSDFPVQDFECGQDCNFILPSGQSAAAARPEVGAMLDIGNFKMRVSSIEGDGPYSGEGVIQKTAFFPIGIKVRFNNIQVNANGRIFSGSAKSVIRSDSWIDEMYNDIETAVDEIEFKPNTLAEAIATLSNPAYYIDNLSAVSEQVGTTLPFSMGSGNNKLQVVGMNFFPDKASYNLSSVIELLDDAEGNPRYLNFMAKNLCITPGGIALSADEARLELVDPVRYNFDNMTQLEFKPAKGGAGTYLTFDCDGFNGVWAQGKVVFSPQVLRPVNAQGNTILTDTVVAGFSTSFTSWSNWVATIDFSQIGEGAAGSGQNLFTYKELEGYIIGVDEAYIDHSTEANPEGMVFPSNYTTHSGPDWQGVYLKTVKVTMPEWISAHDQTDGRIHLTGSNLIIDGQGLTGVIKAENVLSQENGAMGKWPITVDNVKLTIFQNSLDMASFSGELQIPVFEEPFAYKADLQFLNHRTKHTFTFIPLQEYTIPMWFANATITSNSSLSVHINDNSAYVQADLNGAISFQPSIGDIDKMNLSNITFENFVIRSKAAPKYIEIGNFNTATAHELAVAGFGVIFDSMEWTENIPDFPQLELDLGMNLSKGSYGISGSTGLFIKNSISDLQDSFSFDFKGIDIGDIQLAAETGVVNMEGGIAFFKNDPKFGSGFAGNLNMHFIETINLEGSVLFGNVRQGNSNFNYWYAQAMAYLPNTPVPMATPVDVYGFGGGVYYNMALVNPSLPGPRNGSAANIRDNFKIQKGIVGIKASVILGLTPSSRTFNADVSLTAELNLNTGGLNMVAFNGSGYLMQDIDDPDKDEAMVQASVNIAYEFTTNTFSSNFGVTGRIPYSSPLLTVNGNIEIHRSPTLWYLKAGVPSNPMNGSINLGVSGITAKGYFMTGQQLEEPVLPAGLKFQFNSYMVNNTSNNLGVGFMAGLHLGLDIELTLMGTGVIIDAGAGADIALLNYASATCNGRENFGVNKWYAQGQAYVYGSVALDLFWFNVASVELNIIVEAAFPNPTGVHGRVKVAGSFLGYSKSFDESFKLGSFCDIQPIVNGNDQIYREEVELDNLALLGAITPANGLKTVSTSVKPTIEWHQDSKKPKRFTYSDGMGGIIDLLYRFKNEYTWEKQSKVDGSWSKVVHGTSKDEETGIMTLQATTVNAEPRILEGGTTFRIKAETRVEKYLSDNVSDYTSLDDGLYVNWAQATYMEGDHKGQPIKKSKTHTFQTGTNLTEIEEMYVDYTLPYPRQRFYPYQYLNKGKIKFNVSHQEKFQEFKSCGFEIYAEFAPLDGSPPPKRQVVESDHVLEAKFKMSELNPGTIYKLQIVAERRITRTEMRLHPNPACDPVNSEMEGGSDQSTEDPEMQAYLDNNNLNVNLVNFYPPNSVSGPQAVTLTGPPTLKLGPAIPNYGGILSMMGDTLTHRKLLYTIYFRTSEFGSPEAKMATISMKGYNIHPRYYNSRFLPDTYVQDVNIQFNCGEGFDKYDIFGHDYQTAETREYFRFRGKSVSSLDNSLETERWMQWAGNLFRPFIFDHNQEWNDIVGRRLDEVPVFEKLEFTTNSENYTGVKYIQPLLSDKEVGLAAPLSNGSIMFVPGTSSGLNLIAANSGTGWILAPFPSLPYPPQSFEGEAALGDPKIELQYNVDRKGAIINDLDYEWDAQYNIDSPEMREYVHPPAGDYPVVIVLTNYAEDLYEPAIGSSANPPSFIRTRELKVPIQFQEIPIQY